MARVVGNPSSYSFLKIVELFAIQTQRCPSVSAHPTSESVFFRANASFGFPASDIHAIEYAGTDLNEVIVNFLGLYGPSSPLPDYFTQAVIDEQIQVESEEHQLFLLKSESELRKLIEGRTDFAALLKIDKQRHGEFRSDITNKVSISSTQFSQLKGGLSYEEVLDEHQVAKLREKNVTISLLKKPSANQRDFLDVFNHRLITLYLGALCKYHAYRQKLVETDNFIEHLLRFIGAPSLSERRKSTVNWIKILQFSSLIIANRGAPEVLCKVISGYFNVELKNVTIEPYVCRRTKIVPEQQNRLGRRNCQLSQNLSLGEYIAVRSSRFRLNLFNLTDELFQAFIPGNPYKSDPYLLKPLQEIIAFLKPDNVSAEIALHLKEASLLALNLNQTQPSLLGYSSWLHPPSTKPRHVVI